MAKAPENFPVTLVRGDSELTVHQVASFNQAVWDGFGYKQGEDPEYKSLSPAEKAAQTKAENRAPSAVGSGAHEKTVGSNPS